MSRSYKKNPVCTDRPHGAKYWKRQANRRVRKYKDELRFAKYKRVYCSWEIHDWVTRWSKREAIQDYHTHYYYSCGRFWPTWQEDYETEKQFIDKYWATCYRRK